MKKIISLILSIALLANLIAVEAADSDSLPFQDVQNDDWYYNAVSAIYTQKLMCGTEEDLFSPDEATTRAMAVTVLYRLEGKPETGTCSFTDVSAQAYYASAVAWANENGIVYGTDSTHFSPNVMITREQLVSILYRYIRYKGSTALQRSNLNIYQDQKAVSSYALPAVRWAVAVGLISGRSEVQLSPRDHTTRAEFAQMIYNLQTRILDDESVMKPETTVVPVLMFHSVQDNVQNAYSLTTEEFESVISMLHDLDYHTISMQQLVNYVDEGEPLPEQPIMITFDDGYQDNLDNACPILEKYGFCAAISVIGCYVGCDSYNGKKITPHFSLEDAKQYMPATISIESHTSRMHMLSDYPRLEDGSYGVGKRASESAEEYAQRLAADFTESYQQLASSVGAPLTLTYPYGIFTAQSESAAKEAGYRITLTTKTGVNVITSGNSGSLYLLNRINMNRTYTPEEFTELVSDLYYD